MNMVMGIADCNLILKKKKGWEGMVKKKKVGSVGGIYIYIYRWKQGKAKLAGHGEEEGFVVEYLLHAWKPSFLFSSAQLARRLACLI